MGFLPLNSSSAHFLVRPKFKVLARPGTPLVSGTKVAQNKEFEIDDNANGL